MSTYLSSPPASNAKPLSTPYRASYALPPTPPHLPSDPAPYKQSYFEDDDMDLTEETVDDLVNQWWFTNNNNTNPNDSGMNDVPAIVNEEGGHVLSSANSPMVNSPLSSTSLDNNFEGLSEFPFFSSTEALQSPRSPVRYDCIAIAAPASSQTEPNTPLTDNTSLSSVPIKQEPMSPVIKPTRGPGRPRKNASSLRVDTATADADHSSKRKRHSQIERRYRCRLQAGMDSLGEVLPSSRKDKDCDSPTSSAAAAAAAGPRSRKASILIDAREYILELEADKRLLAAENHSLKAELARMKRQRVKETNYYAS